MMCLQRFIHYLVLALLLLQPVAQASEHGGPMESGSRWYQFSHTAMTTSIELEFWASDPNEAEQLANKIFARFDKIDQTMSRYKEDSELSWVNKNASAAPVRVSDELFAVLLTAQEISRLSAGAFDISFASVGYMYDYRNSKQPSEGALTNSIGNINYRNILLDESNQTVALANQAMLLDLGGVAKGYSVDQAVNILANAGIKNARVSAGGDMRLLGDKRGKPWIVGIRDPRNKNSNALVLPLQSVAISTSGDYERFFVNEAGERVHHILSPQTGKPAKGIQSVTVLGEAAVKTDALSTAVFVLGVKKGLALINNLPGLDVIILDEKRKLHYSEGLTPPTE